MPRSRHAQGRPGTVVIPADWQATHAAVIAATLDCTVTIAPAGSGPAWDPTERATLTSAAVAVYTGAATITPREQDSAQSTEAAQDVVPTAVYEVKILAAATGVVVDHIVTVTSSPDAMLTGRRLRVIGVEKGSRRFSRILLAVDAD